MLLLLAAIAALWVVSFWRVYIFGFVTPGSKAQAATMHRGSAYFFISNIHVKRERVLPFGWEGDSATRFLDLRKDLIPDSLYKGSLDRGAAGFRLVRPYRDDAFGIPGAWYIILIIPNWFVATILGLLLARYLSRSIRRQWRIRHNLCLNCGYDLRASSERCPECGSPIPPPQDRPAPAGSPA